MSIHERAGKRGKSYRVVWRDTNGQRQSETFRLERDAKRFNAARMLDPDWTTPDAPVADPTPKGGPTVADIYERWAATRDVERADTDASLYRIQLAPLHGKRWAELTALDVREWLGTLTKARKPDGTTRLYKPRTIRDALAVFRQLLAAAEDADLVRASQANRMRDIKAPRAAKPRHHDDVLTPEEFARVMESAPTRWLAFFSLMALNGCRPSDALGLTPELMDLDAAVVKFGRMKVITRRVNGKPTRVHVGIETDDDGGKTDATWRDETLPPLAVALLRAHLESYPAQPGQPIFRTESGALPDLANVRRIWRRVLDDAGIDRHITPYHLKHSMGTWMAAAGVDAVEGAARMGQSTVTLWMETYARRSRTNGHDSGLAKLAAYAPQLFGASDPT